MVRACHTSSARTVHRRFMRSKLHYVAEVASCTIRDGSFGKRVGKHNLSKGSMTHIPGYTYPVYELEAVWCLCAMLSSAHIQQL
jgi:hypothetical protein